MKSDTRKKHTPTITFLCHQVIKKELVTDDEDIDWVQTEKHVFETASNHPFLVGLHSCFQVLSYSDRDSKTFCVGPYEQFSIM